MLKQDLRGTIHGLNEALVTTFAGGAIGIVLSWGIVQAISPRPFLAELMDDVMRRTDIHLFLTVELLAILETPPPPPETPKDVAAPPKDAG